MSKMANYIDKIVKDEEEYDIIGKLKRYPVIINFPAVEEETYPLQGTANWTTEPSDDDMSFILDMTLQQDGVDQGNFKLVASKFIGTPAGAEEGTPMIYATFSFDGSE